MKHYLYRTTNLLNNKIYIGARSYKGNDYKNDKYMGSGYAIRKAIEKHGIENFKKDILCLFSSKQLLYKYLLLIVDKLFVSRKDTYNLKTGGFYNTCYSLLTIKKMSEIARSIVHSKHKLLTKLKMKISHSGKSFSKLHKDKLSISHKGILNSQLARLKMSIAAKNRKKKLLIQ